jgi:cardiolipin synthase (CMP-forming)
MNLANTLTLFRMALIPFFIMALTYGHPQAALWVFLTAGITDALDGAIARFFNQRTALGAFLDPAADKLILTSAFVVLAVPGLGLAYTVPTWLPVLTIARDVVIVLCVLVMHLTFGIRTFPPTIPGKVTTFFQISYAVGALLKNAYGLSDALLLFLVWSVAGLTVVSGLHYIWRMKVIIKGAA